MSGVRWWSLVWCTRISRRPRTPKARTKEFLTSFSVHVLRTRTIPIHTHTHTHISRQYAPRTRGDEREREIAHQSYDNILNLPTANFRQRDRRREWEQLAGVDGNADAAPSKEPRTSALWIHTHTHTCAHNEGAIANHRLKFQAREFSIPSPPVIFWHTFLSTPRDPEKKRRRESDQELIFFFFVSLSSFTLELTDGLIDNFFQHSVPAL